MAVFSTPSRRADARRALLFSVRPMGERWAIVCANDVIAITETEHEAARLAISAAGTLRVSPVEPCAAPREERSFRHW